MSLRSGAAWCGQVLGWTVLLLALGLVTVAVLLPRAVGGTPYAVLSGSMSPTLPTGTLAVVRPVEIDDVMVGEVVTYQLHSGEATMVTHRVIGTRLGRDGQRELLTQGDTNTTPDAEPVRAVQLQGRLWYAVPHLGRVTALLSSNQRELAITALGGGLGLYALLMLGGAARDRRRAAAAADRPGRHAVDVA